MNKPVLKEPGLARKDVEKVRDHHYGIALYELLPATQTSCVAYIVISAFDNIM